MGPLEPHKRWEIPEAIVHTLSQSAEHTLTAQTAHPHHNRKHTPHHTCALHSQLALAQR